MPSRPSKMTYMPNLNTLGQSGAGSIYTLSMRLVLRGVLQDHDNTQSSVVYWLVAKNKVSDIITEGAPVFPYRQTFGSYLVHKCRSKFLYRYSVGADDYAVKILP
ncbi:hypothetical protein RRG08_046957 [Elysia crispata]|uniref:Uncharacterized protein n=1 Tax=Elysia crispata TaxID=231223 RepID=A0AAE1DVK5_9GAST|nr:hypothetical protein RRG08_046957 [Elysia crispata]